MALINLEEEYTMESTSNFVQLLLTEQRKASNTLFKKKRPIFLWGPPGIGKSDIIHQIGT